MGSRGPTPTPTQVLRLRGSVRAASRKDEPKAPEGAPDRPEWLTQEASQVWDQVCGQLEVIGLLHRTDGNALARYCDLFVRWKAAAKFLAEHGDTYTIKDESGKPKCVMQWPQVNIYSNLSSLLTTLEDRFGLSPSSRTRIQIAPASEKKKESKSRFFMAG